jgi:hypothetical protein
MRRRIAAATIVQLCLLDVAFAQSIKALVCEFTGRHSAELGPPYKSGTTGDRMSFTLAALDAKEKKAQMIGSGGAGDVTMHVQPGQLQFIELTPSGNITVTSGFLNNLPEVNFAAVHSRHVKVFDAIASQYTGICRARQ